MRVMITFVSDYHPSNTGFAQAFEHLHNSIIENKACDHVYVFAEKEYSTPNKNNITVHRMASPRGMRLLINKATREVQNNRIEHCLKETLDKIETISQENQVQMILIESMVMAWLIPILRKRFPHIEVVCRIHGTGPEYTAFYREMKDIAYRDYLLDCVFESRNIAVTTKFYFDFFRDYYKDYGKFIDRNFFILPNTTLFSDELKKCTKNSEKIRILQLGRMDKRGFHQKGFDDTLKALMYIERLNPGIGNKIEYITIGCGERENEFVKNANKLKCVSHVHYSKLENQKVKEFEINSDIIVLPSRCEGMSMFALEAIAAGKPLICTDGNGLESVCKHKYNGYIMSEYDYILMASYIQELVQDADIRIQMGKNSQILYNSECSYEAVAKKYDLISSFLDHTAEE